MKKKLPRKSANYSRKVAISRARSKIQTILATTDFSNGSLAGVRHATALGEKLGAAVALVHVVEPAPRMPGMEAVGFARQDSEVIAQARAHLKKIAKRESKGVLKLVPLVRIGNPFHEIGTTAHEREADLIVIATHGYTGAKRVLLGSTAERVVRHAPCSVLTVPIRGVPKRAGKRPSLRLKKILVPIDFSNTSVASLPLATFLAAQCDSEIILLHVVEKFPIDYLLGPELLNQAITPLMKQGEADLERMAASLAKSTGLRVSSGVSDGKPFEEICAAARRLGVDLIALTTHGYTGLKHVWLGSTAERVVRHASCPVLAVREPGRGGKRYHL